MGNIIFKRSDNQNVCRKAKLFLIWCALTGTHVDAEGFIIRHLVEVAKTTPENVIGVGGIITIIAQALNIVGNFDHLSLTSWEKTLTLPS